MELKVNGIGLAIIVGGLVAAFRVARKDAYRKGKEEGRADTNMKWLEGLNNLGFFGSVTFNG